VRQAPDTSRDDLEPVTGHQPPQPFRGRAETCAEFRSPITDTPCLMSAVSSDVSPARRRQVVIAPRDRMMPIFNVKRMSHNSPLRLLCPCRTLWRARCTYWGVTTLRAPRLPPRATVCRGASRIGSNADDDGAISVARAGHCSFQLRDVVDVFCACAERGRVVRRRSIFGAPVALLAVGSRLLNGAPTSTPCCRRVDAAETLVVEHDDDELLREHTEVGSRSSASGNCHRPPSRSLQHPGAPSSRKTAGDFIAMHE